MKDVLIRALKKRDVSEESPSTMGPAAYFSKLHQPRRLLVLSSRCYEVQWFIRASPADLTLGLDLGCFLRQQQSF